MQTPLGGFARKGDSEQHTSYNRCGRSCLEDNIRCSVEWPIPFTISLSGSKGIPPTPTPCAMLIQTQFSTSFLLEWLRNLTALTSSSLRILILLPTNRIHRIPRLARSHNDPQIIARCREVVIRLIAQRNLATIISLAPNSLLLRKS